MVCVSCTVRHADTAYASAVERDATQTHAKGLDQKSRLIIFKILNAGLLDEVNGAVRTGKEATVFAAVGPSLPTEAVVAMDDVPGFSPGEARQRPRTASKEEDCAFTDEAPDTGGDTNGDRFDGDCHSIAASSVTSGANVAEGGRREIAIKVFKTTLTEQVFARMGGA